MSKQRVFLVVHGIMYQQYEFFVSHNTLYYLNKMHSSKFTQQVRHLMVTTLLYPNDVHIVISK